MICIPFKYSLFATPPMIYEHRVPAEQITRESRLALGWSPKLLQLDQQVSTRDFNVEVSAI